MSEQSGSGTTVDAVARAMAAEALKKGYGYYPLGKTEIECKELAKSEGGLVWDEHAQACWKLFGKAVDIDEDKDDIKEGFETVNFNFHASTSGAAVPSGDDLPGATQGLGSPGWHSDAPQTGVVS